MEFADARPQVFRQKPLEPHLLSRADDSVLRAQSEETCVEREQQKRRGREHTNLNHTKLSMDCMGCRVRTGKAKK